MAHLTANAITSYYEHFKSAEVTFTKEMVQTTGLVPEQVQLKCGIDFWPCVLYAASFQGAKIVVNTKSGLIEKLQQAKKLVNLRLSFKNADTGKNLTFFVAGSVTGTVPYNNSSDVSMLTIQFPKRPPDVLIETVGRILDANESFANRKDELIVVTEETQRKLKLFSRETAVFVQMIPRRCILRELSFTGAKLIMVGVAKFLTNKDMVLRVDFDDPRESVLVKGKVTTSENVEGKKEMAVLSMDYDEAQIPLIYKIRINEYLAASRFDQRVTKSQTGLSGKPGSNNKIN